MPLPKVVYLRHIPLPTEKTDVLFRIDGDTYAGTFLNGTFQTVNHNSMIITFTPDDVDAWLDATDAYTYISQEQP